MCGTLGVCCGYLNDLAVISPSRERRRLTGLPTTNCAACSQAPACGNRQVDRSCRMVRSATITVEKCPQPGRRAKSTLGQVRLAQCLDSRGTRGAFFFDYPNVNAGRTDCEPVRDCAERSALWDRMREVGRSNRSLRGGAGCVGAVCRRARKLQGGSCVHVVMEAQFRSRFARRRTLARRALQRAMAGNARRQRRHSWQSRQRGSCNLQTLKGPVGFESHPLRQFTEEQRLT